MTLSLSAGRGGAAGASHRAPAQPPTQLHVGWLEGSRAAALLTGLPHALVMLNDDGDAFVLVYVENEAHLVDQPGLQATDWPRMAEAWGCPGPESVTARAALRQTWPK